MTIFDQEVGNRTVALKF